MTSKIVLVTGYAGSGKDEVGKILQEKGYKRYAFADIVKVHTADKHGFSFELTNSQHGKNTIIKSTYSHKDGTVRSFLIEESALMKELYNNPAFWAIILEKIIKEENNTKQIQIVITDWRYEAELNHFIKEFADFQIITIRIIRNSVKPLDDQSEHNLDQINCDYTIYNNDTITVLKEQIVQLPF